PDLTWRDMQYLVLNSAMTFNLEDPDWQLTKAGRLYNYKFGYGKLDAYTLIQNAKTYKLLNPQVNIEMPIINVTKPIPMNQEGIISKSEDYREQAAKCLNIFQCGLRLPVDVKIYSGFMAQLDSSVLSGCQSSVLSHAITWKLLNKKPSERVDAFWAEIKHKERMSKYSSCVLNVAISDREQGQEVISTEFTEIIKRRYDSKDKIGNKKRKPNNDLINSVVTDVVPNDENDDITINNNISDEIVDLTKIMENDNVFEFDLGEFNSIFNQSDVQNARKEWFRLIHKVALMSPDDKFETGCQRMQDHGLPESMYNGTFIDPVIGGAIQRNHLLNYKWGEIEIRSSSERKNEGKDLLTTVKETGHKADGVVYTNNNDSYEIGILEVSYAPLKKDPTKDASDFFKLKRMLKDCINFIIKNEVYSGRGNIENNLKMIGMQSSANFNDFYCLQNAMAVCWNMQDVLINNVELLKKNKQSQKVNTEPKKSSLIDSITPTSRSPTRKPKTRKSNQLKTDSTKSRLVDSVRQPKAKPKTKKSTL
ncbi:4594_t:CDS:10, partial [Entrophospora sp. SA101]